LIPRLPIPARFELKLYHSKEGQTRHEAFNLYRTDLFVLFILLADTSLI